MFYKIEPVGSRLADARARQTNHKGSRARLLYDKMDTEVTQQQIRDVCRTDKHEARAMELEALNLHVYARRIRKCGILIWPAGKWRCKKKFCPSCGPWLARSQSHKHFQSFCEMEHPILALYTVSSIKMTDLRRSIGALKECENRIRKRVVMTCQRDPSRTVVAAGVGSIEVDLAKDPSRWNVHAHVVLDTRDLDFAEVHEQWKAVVHAWPKLRKGERSERRTGIFDVQQVIKDERCLATYVAKHHSWCPDPGELPLWKLKILLNAIKRQRLAISWGTRCKKHIAPEKAA